MKTAQGDGAGNLPSTPAAALAQIRSAVLQALPVDEVAERELDAWMREHERPAVKRRLVRRGRMTAE